MKQKINTIPPNNILEFVYCSHDTIKWRKIHKIEEDNKYICGHDLEDNNHFKKFNKKQILGGKIFEQEA